MEDMIAKIVEMDKRARGLSDETAQSRADYEKEITLAKEKIKNDYLERAKERIRINRQTEQKKADESLRRIEAENAVIIETLEKCDRENHDKWVDEIYSRIVSA